VGTERREGLGPRAGDLGKGQGLRDRAENWALGRGRDWRPGWGWHWGQEQGQVRELGWGPGLVDLEQGWGPQMGVSGRGIMWWTQDQGRALLSRWMDPS
jgi:hypothetical protein